MLSSGHAVFLMIPSRSNERVLHPGTVIATDDRTCEATFEEPISPAVGAEVVLYAEALQKFFQQGARVTETRQENERTAFVFERVGEPVSAEQRQTYRVCTVTTGIVARIGREERCPVVDVSPEGIGAIVSHRPEIGTTVDLVIRYWSEEINARVRVQTIQARPDKKFRCGFLAPEKHSPARRALERIAACVQRTQLRRLSGAA